MTRYRTIVADPPWAYPEGFALGPSGALRTCPLPYPSMTMEEICSLPVPDLAERDCRLFLWATTRHLRAAFDVLDAWGFRYRQALIWHKRNLNLPHALAPNAEFVLAAVRGNPPRLGTLRSAVVSTNLTRHSVKPEVWLEHFEQLSPPPSPRAVRPPRSSRLGRLGKRGAELHRLAAGSVTP